MYAFSDHYPILRTATNRFYPLTEYFLEHTETGEFITVIPNSGPSYADLCCVKAGMFSP
ncbi:hypothetical protein [Spirosoma telluris]|uniref:hypothetical protein n=1 Tax=Spirosoma telluris TaxID=2183553 RepID=UPI002FC3CDFC